MRRQAAQDLETNLSEFLSRAQEHINTVLAKLDDAKTRNEAALSSAATDIVTTVSREVQYKTERPIQTSFDGQVDAIVDSAMTKVKAHARHLLEGYMKDALESTCINAVSAAEKAEIQSAEAIVGSLEARLVSMIGNELAAIESESRVLIEAGETKLAGGDNLA